MPELLILSPVTSSEVGSKQWYERQSLARSHAARVAHQRKKQARGLRRRQKEHKAVPRVLLCHDNLDPFDCLPIKITSEINHAIIFRRECFGPGSRLPPQAVATLRSIIAHDERTALQKRGTAAAFSLNCLGVWLRVQVRPVNPDRITEVESTLKIQALSTLRALLDVPAMREQIILCIMWMFETAVITGNVEEASFHGVALRNLSPVEPMSDARCLSST